MPSSAKEARRSIWRYRGRRFATGLNVCLSLILATVAAVMVNYLAYRHYCRWNLSWSGYYRLSDKTRSLLADLDTSVTVIAFFQKSHRLCNDVQNLLKEYEYEGSRSQHPKLTVEIVDPDRELARAKELSKEYDLREPNVVVFQAGHRRKYVDANDLVDHEIHVSGKRAFRKLVGFKGEQVFSSAIQSIAQAARPTVHFLCGHGERDIKDFGEQSGYSGLARAMSRDNIEVRPLLLSRDRTIPEDCSAIVVAGPDKKISLAEIDILSDFLDRNGRVFFLIDPGIVTGLEGLLDKWGVRLDPGVVVGLSLTGRELVVNRYGIHPITRNLTKATTMFYMPRPVEPLEARQTVSGVRADKPRVSVLAANSTQGWLEMNLKQSPPRFDKSTDRRGPVAVAVAVEKGPVSGIDVEIRSTRIVVAGDSYFVSNGALSSAVGGNIDFFMSAMNWLLEREALMAISPKDPRELRLDMNRRQLRTAYMLAVGAIPAFVACLGLFVWAKRRT